MGESILTEIVWVLTERSEVCTHDQSQDWLSSIDKIFIIGQTKKKWFV